MSKVTKNHTRFKLREELSSNIQKFASSYEKHADEDHLIEENWLMGLRKTSTEKQCLCKSELLRVAKWKSYPIPFVERHIKRNEETHVKEVTESALSIDNESAIAPLTMLHGVGFPVASAVLHFFHKDHYPILDRWALWAARSNEGDPASVPVTLKYELWKEYVTFCRKIAQENGVPMRTLDRAMWYYSAKVNYKKER